MGQFSGLGPFNVNSFVYHTLSKYPGYTGNSEADLASFISSAMPSTDIGSCDTQCGQDVAAYLWSLRGNTSGPIDTTLSCDSDSPVYYGQRGLKLLASYEYDNSLQALFKNAFTG